MIQSRRCKPPSDHHHRLHRHIIILLNPSAVEFWFHLIYNSFKQSLVNIVVLVLHKMAYDIFLYRENLYFRSEHNATILKNWRNKNSTKSVCMRYRKVYFAKIIIMYISKFSKFLSASYQKNYDSFLFLTQPV